MTAMRSREFVRHRRGCSARKLAQKGDWGNAWAFIVHPYIVRHPVTKKLLRYTYTVWRCNDADCPALLGVRCRDLDAVLPRW